jgi:hypothetical protein
VVDHSTVCRGGRPTPYPAFYMALVPESATVQDIEAALAHRRGLLTVARLSATTELRPISEFRCIRDLHQNSLQLEVWDSDDRDRR